MPSELRQVIVEPSAGASHRYPGNCAWCLGCSGTVFRMSGMPLALTNQLPANIKPGCCRHPAKRGLVVSCSTNDRSGQQRGQNAPIFQLDSRHNLTMADVRCVVLHRLCLAGHGSDDGRQQLQARQECYCFELNIRVKRLNVLMPACVHAQAAAALTCRAKKHSRTEVTGRCTVGAFHSLFATYINVLKLI